VKKIYLILIALALLAAMTLPTGSVFAAPTDPHAGSFVNAGDVPPGSKLVLNITYKVTNDEDSGNFSYWALDNYNESVQVWQTPDGSFYSIAKYSGKWQTFTGALSPGTGVAQASDATGTFEGGQVRTFTGTLNPTPAYSTKGNIGTFDFKGTKADVLANGGNVTPFIWKDTYFIGASGYTYLGWGWTYHYKSQTWNNFDSGTTGDIVMPFTGTWILDVLSGSYVHDMFISTQSPTGAITGTGGYPVTGPPYTPGYDWTLVGQITGTDVTFTVTYSNGYTATLIGKVGLDGNMSGTLPLNWTATRVP